MDSKNLRYGYLWCMLIEVLFGCVSLFYWLNLKHGRVYNSTLDSTLTCGGSFHGCCPVYSGCGETEGSFLSDIHVRYLDIDVLDYEKTNCPSLYDIIDRDKDSARWKIFRPGVTEVRDTDYCKINSACDKFTRMGTSDFRTYNRSVSVGMYMFGTNIPISDGCNEERIIDNVVTNYNQRRYSQEIAIYVYLSVFSFILVVPTLCCSYIEAKGKDCSDCSDCLPSHSNVKHVQLRGSA